MSPSPSITVRAHAKRARVACIACQQKKQKCDGRAPSCGNCVKGSRTCIIEDPSTKRQYPRGYVEALEERVARLEASLSVEDGDFDSIDHDFNRPHKHTQQPQEVPVSIVASIDANAQDSLQNESANNNGETMNELSEGPSVLDLLCLRAAGGEPHYFGSSSAFSFTKLFTARLRGAQVRGPEK
ncbi:Regulatory protein CAT8 [Colletotrichum fructicola]|nr:Regulatory protein CAT8 [Colletotrichum fructicola]